MNSFGFRGREVAVPKPATTYRIAFMGDSCTELGTPSNYPALVEARLNEIRSAPDLTFESVTVAVSGYSSHQGKVLAERYASTIQADAVFVYYGWNDHWDARGSSDENKVMPQFATGWQRVASDVYQQSRTAQAVERFATAQLGTSSLTRVSTEAYRRNLADIIDLYRQNGTAVVLITAPTSHYRLGVPDSLVERKLVPDKDTAIQRHRAYNEIVREVADQQAVELLDLEREFASRRDLNRIFTNDGIHLTKTGLDLVAERVAKIVDTRLIE